MLIDFSFSNFKSYRDEQRFSMRRPTNAQKHEENDWPHRDISTVAGIYGGNASGKSAFIEAFMFVADFVVQGFNPRFDLAARCQPFRLDEASRKKPSDFLADFIAADGKRYLFELSIESGTVAFESLRTYKGNRSSRIYERERMDEGIYAYRYGQHFSGMKRPFEQMTRPDAPFIAVLYAANVSLAKPVYGFFRNRVGFFQADLYHAELDNLALELKKGSPVAAALSRLMASSNLGISVVQRKDPLEELQKASQSAGNPSEGSYEDLASGMLALSNPGLPLTERRKKAHDIAQLPPRPRYEFVFTHRGAGGFEETFSEKDESKGTLSVLAFFSLALRLLSTRSVGFVDEIDSSLHPNYVQELVALFKDPLTNPHQSQLIFTTHDVSLITRTGADKRVLDQDQIWFAEKGRDGSSALYPVTSVASSRWDENFGRNYLHGVYGASPRPGFHEAFAQAERDIGSALQSVGCTAEAFGGEA